MIDRLGRIIGSGFELPVAIVYRLVLNSDCAAELHAYVRICIKTDPYLS